LFIHGRISPFRTNYEYDLVYVRGRGCNHFQFFLLHSERGFFRFFGGGDISHLVLRLNRL
jgi:hypothetical protein